MILFHPETCYGAICPGDSHIKVTGMLVVSFRGLNYGFWSHLGCSGRNADIFSHQGIVYKCTCRVAREEVIQKHRHTLITGDDRNLIKVTIALVCLSFLEWYLLGIK